MISDGFSIIAGHLKMLAQGKVEMLAQGQT